MCLTLKCITFCFSTIFVPLYFIEGKKHGVKKTITFCFPKMLLIGYLTTTRTLNDIINYEKTSYFVIYRLIQLVH